MTEEQGMTDHNKKGKIFFLVSFLTICVIYIVSEHVSTKDYISNDGNRHYISQYLLPPESTKVTSEVLADDTDSSFNNSPDILKTNETESKEKSDPTNISISIIKSEDAKTIFRVSYEDLAAKIEARNVFVEMKDINKSTENIFFVETRCSTEKMSAYFRGNKAFVLNARQCCALESTAQMNLDRNVYIFHSCSLDDNFFEYSPKYVKELFSYPNVYVVRLNTSEVFSNSPLEELDKRKLLETSNFPVEHTSDLMRLTLLWKFGGTYCDLDVVTIRSLHNLKTNWAGMQDSDTIANGVLNFEPEGSGHNMLQRALEHVNRHYDPSNWSSNGPLLVTPIILQECRVQKVTEAQIHCHGNFTVYETSILYPLYYTQAEEFFDNNSGQRIVADVKIRSYSVHIWNKISHEMVVTVGSTQAYGLLADEYCPRVYRNCGTHF